MVLSVFEESAGILKTFTEWAERGKKKRKKQEKGKEKTRDSEKKRCKREKAYRMNTLSLY